MERLALSTLARTPLTRLSRPPRPLINRALKLLVTGCEDVQDGCDDSSGMCGGRKASGIVICGWLVRGFVTLAHSANAPSAAAYAACPAVTCRSSHQLQSLLDFLAVSPGNAVQCRANGGMRTRSSGELAQRLALSRLTDSGWSPAWTHECFEE